MNSSSCCCSRLIYQPVRLFRACHATKTRGLRGASPQVMATGLYEVRQVWRATWASLSKKSSLLYGFVNRGSDWSASGCFGHHAA